MGRHNEKHVWKALAIITVTLLMASNTFTVASATEIGNVGVDQTITAESMEVTAENTVNYTQMALDFVREHYPDKELKVYSNLTRRPYPETGYSYELIGIDIIPGTNRPEDTVIVSIRHDTLYIEFGYDQFWNDYQEFLASLPAHYRKMLSESRTAIMQKFGYYPDISDPVSETFRTNFTVRFNPENQTKVTSYLKELGLDYSIHCPPYGETHITSYMSLRDCLLLNNQTYVRSARIWFGNVPPECDSSNAFRFEILLAVGTALAIVGTLAFIGVRKYKHMKSEKKEEVGEEHVEKGKE